MRALSDVAFIAVDGLFTREDRPFPREIAVAFFKERQSLAWLVQPEAMWARPAEQLSGQPMGAGLHPALVAGELAAACEGYRVYSEFHLAAAGWLRRLFAVAGQSLPMTVRDLRKLVMPLCTGSGQHATESVRRADVETSRMHPAAERAAREAARHAHFVKLLAAQA